MARAYSGAPDLRLMQTGLSEWTQSAGGCVYYHPGDIPHRLYNGMRGRFPLSEIVRLWLRAGELTGFACVYPAWRGFDVQVHPGYRGDELEQEILSWAYQQTCHWLNQVGESQGSVITDVMSGDPVRRELLCLLGYEERRRRTVLTSRSLRKKVVVPALPSGFHTRTAKGFDDAARLAAVHRGAFGSTWTAEQYRDEVMAKPGYGVEREIVVEAPDGGFAAFCVYWVDPVNRVGYFEPVGTHEEYRRRGLARCMMSYTMDLMRLQGMRQAAVMYERDNPAAGQLYHSLGFQDGCELFEYSRPFTVSRIADPI